MTLELYNFITDKLPPTPSRFHYIFNLRDLSRVYEGLLLSVADKVDSAASFLRLWHNEVGRRAGEGRAGLGGRAVRGRMHCGLPCGPS